MKYDVLKLAPCALLPILFCVAAATSRHQAVQTQARSYRSITTDLSKGATFTFKITPDLPEFTFKVIPDAEEPDAAGNAQAVVEDVEVYRANTKEPLQHLAGCNWAEMEPPVAGSNWFRADDVNFDGYRDLYVMTMWGATGNELGCVWLYNPSTREFDYSEEFSQLSGYRLDATSKTILTLTNGGMAGMVHQANKYKIENNRPVLVWSENQEWDADNNQFHCVVRELQAGALVTVRDQWGKSHDDIGPCDPNKLFRHPEATKPPAP